MAKNPFKDSEDKRDEITLEQEEEIKELYDEALDELKKEFKRFYRSGTQYAKARREQLKQIKNEVNQVMRYVDTQTESIVTNNTKSMVDAVLANNQQYLSGLGYSSYINNPAIKADVVNKIFTGKLYENKWNLSSAIWGDNKAKLNEINKIISKGVLKNKSIYDIAKDLEKYVNPNMRKGFDWSKMFPGSRKTVDYNAQRLARTTIQHAYQEAFVSATINNPFIDAYRWVTSGGHNVCTLCMDRASLDEFGLGEGIFPKDQLPLDHPNGNCTFEVVVSMSDEEIADAIADWYLGEGDPSMNEQLDRFADYLKNN